MNEDPVIEQATHISIVNDLIKSFVPFHLQGEAHRRAHQRLDNARAKLEE